MNMCVTTREVKKKGGGGAKPPRFFFVFFLYTYIQQHTAICLRLDNSKNGPRLGGDATNKKQKNASVARHICVG